jgi:hypothetical protein
VIYVIQAGDRELFKVGVAAGSYPAAVRQRCHELQIGCPDALRIVAMWLGEREDEERLHVALADSRVRGEWFGPSELLSALIAEHPVLEEDARGNARRIICILHLPQDLVLRLDRVRPREQPLTDFVEWALRPYVDGVWASNQCARVDNRHVRLEAA